MKIGICKYSIMPLSMIQKLCSRVRLLERMIRMEPRFAVRINNDEILMPHHGYMYKLTVSKGKVYEEMKCRPGMNNPLGTCSYTAHDGIVHYLIGDY